MDLPLCVFQSCVIKIGFYLIALSLHMIQPRSTLLGYFRRVEFRRWWKMDVLYWQKAHITLCSCFLGNNSARSPQICHKRVFQRRFKLSTSTSLSYRTLPYTESHGHHYTVASHLIERVCTCTHNVRKP